MPTRQAGRRLRLRPRYTVFLRHRAAIDKAGYMTFNDTISSWTLQAGSYLPAKVLAHTPDRTTHALSSMMRLICFWNTGITSFTSLVHRCSST